MYSIETREVGCDSPVTELLTDLQSCFDLQGKKSFEFSWKLKPGVLQKKGRASCWVEGDSKNDFHSVATLLDYLKAPAEVQEAQAACQHPYIEGIGLSLTANTASYRLYLHSRNPGTGKDSYEAWQWAKSEGVRKYQYMFHFFAPGHHEKEVATLIPDCLLPVFRQLTSDKRFRQLSGYWLRYNEEGRIDQVDLCFPWYPLAGSVPGMLLLADLLKLDKDACRELFSFPIRHIAFKTEPCTPELTIYTSGEIAQEWPENEEALQEQVLVAARQQNAAMEKELFSALPVLPAAEQSNTIGRFYDGPIETWKKILGPGMHYHAGLFREDSFTDEAMEQALADAVTSLYPFLPAGGTVYDIGCGWGGPLQMITRDLGCRVLGLTPSETQYNYLSSLGYSVRLGNAEQTLLPGRFDCVLMLESLCHIADKERLLASLKMFTSRLVIRLNCQDNAPPSLSFGNSMHMISSHCLKTMLHNSGWQIRHWKNVRRNGLPSVAVWNRRLQMIPLTDDEHIEILRMWTSSVLTDLEAWGANNPLIEVVAES